MKKTSFLLVVVLILGFGIASRVYAYEGYEAGREWGREHGITDTDYNSADTSAFAEGVRQAAREQQQQREQAE
ncbi:MAG: hypothetical protein ABH891_02785 [Candidatus Omnitrophota bacterium]